MVEFVPPMLATAGPLPADQARYAFEPKWDGFRAIVAVSPGNDSGARPGRRRSQGRRVHVWTRRGNDLTDRCPELAAGLPGCRSSVLLDGELIVLGGDGRPDFEAVRARALSGHLSGELCYVAFDLLRLGDCLTTALPFTERRRLLEGLGVEGPAWRVTPSHPGAGTALFEATRDLGLEGVVAKALHAPYRAGVRSATWIKTKHWRLARFVVGGFSPPDPDRRRSAGLLLGAADGAGTLRFAGTLEWGFRGGEMDAIRRRLRPRAASAFDGFRGWAGVEHAEPEIFVEVRFLERTAQGLLRHASFQRVVA